MDKIPKVSFLEKVTAINLERCKHALSVRHLREGSRNLLLGLIRLRNMYVSLRKYLHNARKYLQHAQISTQCAYVDIEPNC